MTIFALSVSNAIKQLLGVCLNNKSLDSFSGDQSDLPVVATCRSPLACDVGQIKGNSSRVPCPPGGAYRDRHERGVRDAMDALLRETSVDDADGEVVWF